MEKTGLVDPEVLQNQFPQTVGTISQLEKFHEYKDWIAFDYLGKTEVPLHDLEYIVRKAGILPRRKRRYATTPFIVVAAVSLRKGYICILRRSGNARSKHYLPLKTKLAIALGRNGTEYVDVEFSIEELNRIAKLYRERCWATNVKHDTTQGWLVYDNPTGIEADSEVAQAESAYGTIRKIERGEWRAICIKANDPAYEIRFSKSKGHRNRFTVNPLRLSGYLTKQKATRILDHVLSFVTYVKN